MNKPTVVPSIAEQIAQGRGYTGSEPKQLTEVASAPVAEVPDEPKEVEPTSRVGTAESKSFVAPAKVPTLGAAKPAPITDTPFVSSDHPHTFDPTTRRNK